MLDLFTCSILLKFNVLRQTAKIRCPADHTAPCFQVPRDRGLCASLYVEKLDTIGIATVRQVDCRVFSRMSLILGGLQIFCGDATGSLVYQLILDTKDGRTLEIVQLPSISASCTNYRVSSWPVYTVVWWDCEADIDYLTSSVLDRNSDLHELDLTEARWLKPTVNWLVPGMSGQFKAHDLKLIHHYRPATAVYTNSTSDHPLPILSSRASFLFPRRRIRGLTSD
jgi:hypothetical protein